MTDRPKLNAHRKAQHYAYLRHGDPIPKGAKVVSDLKNTPHGKYSVLIQLPAPRK